MIRIIAALDNKNGIADAHGIPWQGKLPSDTHYYRTKIKHTPVIMGYGVYAELSAPYPGALNYVATHSTQKKLRSGFALVPDARQFLQEFSGDIWNVGGAQMYASTLDLAQELYLTRIYADFNCTKFFPAFEHDFKLISQSSPQTENGIALCFEIWKRR